MTEDQKSIAERAEYHKGNLKDLTKDEIVHFLPAVLANKDAVIAELRAALSKSKAELDEWRFTNKIDEMQREIERLSAHVAKSQPVEQGEPYAYANAFGDLFKNRDEIEGVATELFTHPVRTMSDEPRYTVDQIADAACHAEVNDSKFESMCVYLGGIKGATA